MIRLKTLLSEQGTKKITVDIGDADKYCQVLRLTKADADYIINANKEAYSKIIDTQFANLQTELVATKIRSGDAVYKMNPVVLKTYRNEINAALTPAKSLIYAEMSIYYNQLVYSSCGLNKPVPVQPVAVNISNILFNELIKNYEASFIWKRLASTFVNKGNVDETKQLATDMVRSIGEQIAVFIEDVFTEFIKLGPVEKYIEQKEKTAPQCDTVVIVRDKNYNPVKPYSPRKTYMDFDFMTSRPSQIRGTIVRAISPKIDSILDGLV